MVEGMMLAEAALPALQSFPPLAGPSTQSWLAVAACTVVIKPSTIPKLSYKTLEIGAKQLVVQEALDTMLSSGFTNSWFTPYTKVGVASLAGAERITLLAPPFK